MRTIPLAVLGWLAGTAAAAQDPSDSTARRDTVRTTQHSMAIAEAEPPPVQTGARLSDLLTVRGLSNGLRTAPAGGALGSAGRFRMRGPQTIVDERMPLVILDGMRLDAASDLLGGPARLEDLNPEEIESIEAYPGPAATAQYGPGAANGVIIIRTREGHEGPPRWESYAEAGTRRPYRSWPSVYGGVDVDNTDSVYRTGGCTLQVVAAGACVQDLILRLSAYPFSDQLRTALRRQYGLSVTGGLPRVYYFVSGEVDGDGGLFALSSDEIARLNALGQPPRTWTRYPERDGGAHLRANLRVRPSHGLAVTLRGARITDDLRLATPPSFLFGLPGNAFQQENTHAVTRWLGVAEAEWRPVEALTVRGAIGGDAVRVSDKSLLRRDEGPTFPGFIRAGYVSDGRTEIDTRTIDISAEYEFLRSRDVSLRTRAGYQHIRFERDSLERFGAGLDSGETTFDSASVYTVYQEKRWGGERGLYVQQRLDYKGVWDLTATLRHDDFGNVADAAIHPSIAVSWFPGALRIRAGYGSAGRRPFLFGPERTRELTGSVDGTLLNGHLTFGVTLYDMRSTVVAPFPLSPGIGAPQLPEARISNRGVEISLEGQLLNQADAALALTFVAWGNRNRVVSMDGPPLIQVNSRHQPGYPAGGYWARPVLGYVDLNGDGILAPSEVLLGSEQVWAGTPYPTQGAALAGDLSLRRAVRLGATFEYAAGHRLFNRTEWNTCAFSLCRAAVDPATPLGRQAYAVAAAGGAITPGFIEDADFLKLREVWVSVAAPRAIAAALRARAATIALVGRNLLTWTGYSGVDPEPVIAEAPVGQIEFIADRLVLPALPEWSLRVRLAY
ncbi:MAG TPA: TonB-dependent receptor [Gemmatimonadales bacterium]|jgi:outer membrane receptor protein involved in Fe transport|nr:TonB-dependent receptor [Gemmatimonadales bacterium]